MRYSQSQIVRYEKVCLLWAVDSLQFLGKRCVPTGGPQPLNQRDPAADWDRIPEIPLESGMTEDTTSDITSVTAAPLYG